MLCTFSFAVQFSRTACRSYLSASCGRVYILPHFASFVKRFFKLFSKFFELRLLSLPFALSLSWGDLIIISLSVGFVKRFFTFFQKFFSQAAFALSRFPSLFSPPEGLYIIALRSGFVNTFLCFFQYFFRNSTYCVTHKNPHNILSLILLKTASSYDIISAYTSGGHTKWTTQPDFFQCLTARSRPHP